MIPNLHYMFKQMLLIKTNYEKESKVYILLDFCYYISCLLLRLFQNYCTVNEMQTSTI